MAVGVLLGVMGSCSSPPPTDGSIQDLTPAEANDLIEASMTNGGSLVVLDVRTPAEFDPEHIEGAQNKCVNCGSFDQDIEGLDKNAAYLVYCRTGNRSATAANTMAAAGFTSLYNMTGGIVEWKNEGFPVVANP
jgi:rhodanese-related sulfurtransferase